MQAEVAALTSGLLEPMRQAADMVEWHSEGILAHLATRTDDGLLGRAQQFVLGHQTQGSSNRSAEYQTAMLYFVAGKLEIPHYA